jgi:hypothetical protein
VGWLAAVATLATFTAVRADGGTATAAPSDDPRCNGSVLLCDRPLDQVVFAATHNANASAADGFLFGNQPRGIEAQLDAGYRGLLIDVYVGLSRPGRGVVLTDRAPLTAQERAEQVAELGEPAVRTAEPIREEALGAGGTRALYLCHGLCGIGASPLEPELAAIRNWLEANPREVLIVFVEDAVPPEPIVTAFRRTGLDRYASALAPDRPAAPTAGGPTARCSWSTTSSRPRRSGRRRGRTTASSSSRGWRRAGASAAACPTSSPWTSTTSVTSWRWCARPTRRRSGSGGRPAHRVVSSRPPSAAHCARTLRLMSSSSRSCRTAPAIASSA